MIGVPLDRLLSDHLELDPFVFHVRRQFHATQNVGLTNCIQLDGVASTAHFLAMLNAFDFVSDPPNAGIRDSLKDTAFFFRGSSRHGITSHADGSKPEKSGTKSGTRPTLGTTLNEVELYKLLIYIGAQRGT